MFFTKVLTCGVLETNAYLVGLNANKGVILLDAPQGCFDIVGTVLKKTERRLEAVFITHAHFDHILDIGYFAENGIPIYAHSASQDEIENPQTFDMLGESTDKYPRGRISVLLTEGTSVSAAGLSIEVLGVPGHTPDSLAYYIPDHSVCFVGDLIFRDSVGRTDLPGGDFDQLAESIQTKIYSLDDSTVIYPGHGPSTRVGSEKRSNPFVRG